MSLSTNDLVINALLVIVAALISGLVGVIISNRDFKKTEIRRLKIKVLQQMMGSRYEVNGKEFLGALNQVAIVFCDSKEVLTALKVVADDVMTPNRNPQLSNQRLLDLFKARFKNLDINTEPLTDNFFLTAFIPHQYKKINLFVNLYFSC
jgi:hypothetical protein